jgi:two-component system, NarL family, sensor histidine kinase DesK
MTSQPNAKGAQGCASGEPGAAQDIARMWSAGWQRYVFPSVWLVYLGQAIAGVHRHSSGASAVAGYVVVAAFGVCYLLALPVGWQHRNRTFWYLYGLALGLTVAECFFARADAFVFLVYVTVLTVATRRRWSGIAVLGYATVATVVPVAVPAWHSSLDWDSGLTVLLVGFAMFGFFHVIQSNRELAAARAEVARLAAENERSRIARDLHDLLGHSLTTITIKAGLARKLGERGEAERAYTEITEVEALSRRTLGDVRAAVSGHREVTLAGELATAREVLRAAAITAEVPGSVDVVAPQLSELFGWVVREGVTNIVRHSHSQACRISFGRDWIELGDSGNGSGSTAGKGSGLAGLRDRLAAQGGTLHATTSLSGFTLRAEVPLHTGSTPAAKQLPAHA